MNDPLSSPRALGEDAQSEGFVPLFNGKDLKGWKVYNGQESAWGTEEGLLFTRGGNGGRLMTQKVYADFELRLEYKMSKRGDSGVVLRLLRRVTFPHRNADTTDLTIKTSRCHR